MGVMQSSNYCTALENGIKSLYHYTSFHEARLADILGNQRIYCSNPSTFNDPWDCKPFFDPDVIDDPSVHAEVAERFIAGQVGGPTHSDLEELLRHNPLALKVLIMRFSEEFEKSVPSRWGLLCLAASSLSTLMWSHYSKNHTGICLEFGVDNSVFKYAREVDYEEEYPRFKIFEDETEWRNKILLVKSVVWKYEQEYRLICPRLNAHNPDHPLLLEGDFLRFPPGALKSIIVGCQADLQAIKQVVDRYAPELPVRKAYRSLNRYSLQVLETV